MKRVLAALLTMLALAACASPLAKAETQQQALDAAAQRAGQLKSAKFDLAGNVKMTFPAELGKQLGQSGAASGSIALDMTGIPAFNQRVYAFTRQIPRGETRTYAEVASGLRASATVILSMMRSLLRSLERGGL